MSHTTQQNYSCSLSLHSKMHTSSTQFAIFNVIYKNSDLNMLKQNTF